MGIIEKKQCIITLFLPSPFKWTILNLHGSQTASTIDKILLESWEVFMHFVLHEWLQCLGLTKIYNDTYNNKKKSPIIVALQLGPVMWPIFSQNHGIQPLIYKRWKTKTQLKSQFLAFFTVQYNKSMQEKTLYSVIPTHIHSRATTGVKYSNSLFSSW